MIFLTIYLSRELGFGTRFATLAIGTAGLGSIFGSILGGQLADQVGRRTVMLAALFGSAACLVLLSFIQGRLPFLLGIFAFALIVDMYRPAASAMIGDLVASEKRQYSFGLVYISINLGFAIAPPLGGMLATVSYQWLFWGDAITTALYGLIVLFLVNETSPKEADCEVPARTVFVFAALKHMVTNLPFVVFCLAAFMSHVVFTQSFSTLPIAIMQLGYTEAQFGRLIAINGFLIVILQLPLTRWLSRYNRIWVIAVGGLFIAVGFGLGVFATTLPMFAFTIAIWTCGEMFQAPFTQAVVTDLAPAHLRGRYLGVFSMCFALALSIGAPVGGAIMDQWGQAVLWQACFWIGLAAVMLYASVKPGTQST